MLATDADALECDLAEVYGVFDLRALPLLKVATLAYGLPEDSRIKRCMSGVQCRTRDLLLAIVADRLGLLVWMQTENGHKNRGRPKSIVDLLLKKPEEQVQGFSSSDNFEAARARILRGN